MQQLEKFTTLRLGILATAFLAPNVTYGAEHVYEFEKINAIVASAGINIVVQEGLTQIVLAETQADWKFDRLKLSVESGTLTASQEFGFWDYLLNGNLLGAVFGNGQMVTVNLTVEQITSVSANSGSQVSLTAFSGEALTVNSSSGASVMLDNISFDDAHFSASSGGEINASGTCVNANISSSSGADIEAAALLCATINARASSGASAEIYANDSATAHASSGGSVKVFGTPAQTNFSDSSGGNVASK